MLSGLGGAGAATLAIALVLRCTTWRAVPSLYCSLCGVGFYLPQVLSHQDNRYRHRHALTSSPFLHTNTFTVSPSFLHTITFIPFTQHLTTITTCIPFAYFVFQIFYDLSLLPTLHCPTPLSLTFFFLRRSCHSNKGCSGHPKV